MTDYLLAGRYRLTGRIAAGGMGEVWRGEDELLNRPVAVKLLPTGRAGDEAFLARFRAEARYAASLSHPGIAPVAATTASPPSSSSTPTWSIGAGQRGPLLS